MGILRRAEERGKELPPQLKEALEVQAGLGRGSTSPSVDESCHMDQHDECADLPAGIDSKHACATGGVANTLSTIPWTQVACVGDDVILVSAAVCR